MAVVTDKEASFGSGQSNYVVNKPVMLEPGSPMSASVGDVLDIPVTISKTTERTGSWRVEFTALNKVGEVQTPAQTVEIPEKGSITVPFKVRFVEIGEAELAWKIVPVDGEGKVLTDGENSSLVDSVSNKFQVVFPAPLLRENHSFTLKKGKETELFALFSPELQSVDANFKLRMANSPVVYMENSISFLLGYPYGCLEQTSSQTLPWVYADVVSSFFSSFPKYEAEERIKVLQAAADKLLRHQRTRDGALSYWIGDQSNDSYALKFVPYGALTLLLCREQGAIVPQPALDALMKYLDGVSEKTDGLVQECFAAWVLAKAGRLAPAKLNKLLDREEELDKNKDTEGRTDRGYRLYLALALIESRQEGAAEKALAILEKKSSKITGNAYYYDWVREEELELMIRSKAAPGSEATNQYAALYMKKKMEGNRYNDVTWGGGWQIMALGEYLSTLEKGGEDQVVDITNSSAKQEVVLAASGRTVNLEVEKMPETSLLLKEGDTAYGEVSLEGRPRKIEFDGVGDKGFLITRKYERYTGTGWEEADEFTVGDIVRITLLAESSKKDSIYIAMEDYIPSVFEAINPELGTQGSAFYAVKDDYYVSDWVSNKEYHKDRVRFFINHWHSGGLFRAVYLARVTKSGQASAPPAKVELMYEPQSYGLSKNKRFTVSPRVEDK